MNLTEFVTEYTGSVDSANIFRSQAENIKPQLAGQFINEIEPVLATLFWQIASQSFRLSEKKSTFKFPSEERIVIPQEGGGYSLLCLRKKHPEKPVTANIQDLIIGQSPNDLFYRWKNDVIEQFPDAIRTIDVGAIQKQRINATFLLANSLEPTFFTEMLAAGPLKVLFATMPDTNLTGVSVANSSHGVGINNLEQIDTTSTAGLYTKNTNYQYGVTISYHPLVSKWGKRNFDGMKVLINGKEATIVSSDKTTDSCFAVFSSAQQPKDIRPINSVISGETPQQWSSVRFDGYASGPTETIVRGWNDDLLLNIDGNQVKVFTDRVTNPGDSGAVLLDKNNQAIGFSFYVSGYKQKPEVSAWIWADSVMKAHNLFSR